MSLRAVPNHIIHISRFLGVLMRRRLFVRRTVLLFVSVLLFQLLLFQLLTTATPASELAVINHSDKIPVSPISVHKSRELSASNALVAQANSAKSPSVKSPSDPPKIVSSSENVKFDVNDISFLWPVPTNAREANELIASDEKTANGKSQIWPKSAFDTFIKTAPATGVKDSTGNTNQINFNDGELSNTFNQQKTWKVVAMRIDPSAPGSSSKMVNERGSVPQIRLIMQPVTVDRSGQVIVHDYTAHLVYSFTKGSRRPAVPDQAKFAEIVNDLKRLKANLAASGISTDGKPLGVHPGFEGRNGQVFKNALKTFIKKHVAEENLAGVSFMGLEPPEPWIFSAMVKQNGSFAPIPAPTLGSNKAQMLSFRDSRNVSPVPAPENLGSAKGVSTTLLFEPGVESKLSSPVFSGQSRPRFQEIPDIVANPERAHFFNTDCVSCHSESARRQNLNIRTGDALFKYQLPAGISSVDPAVLPTDQWNVRNFGWFPNFQGATETVTMRTANETAEAVEFINQQYLINTPVNNAVAKDNGIGGANLRRRPLQISQLGKDDFCVLRSGESVGIDAIESVGNGFAKVNIAIPNAACPSFKGDMFIFQQHFDLSPIIKTVARKNDIGGVEGAILRRRPLQVSMLTSDEVCELKPNQSVGVNAVQAVRDGFTKVNIIVPSPSCPSFKENVFVFTKHFNFD